jgi:hypothetical protein
MYCSRCEGSGATATIGGLFVLGVKVDGINDVHMLNVGSWNCSLVPGAGVVGTLGSGTVKAFWANYSS